MIVALSFYAFRPMARDVMSKHPERYNNTDFSIPYIETVSVNWPFDPKTTVIEQPSGEYVINPVFERHIRELENWSLGSKFANIFPELAPHIRINDNPVGRMLV